MRASLFAALLTAHLVAVVIAYAPAVLAPFVAARSLEPLLRVTLAKLAVPAAATLPFSGAGLVIVAGINPTTQLWLWLSLLLYVATVFYVVVRQRPRVLRLLRGERSPELLRSLRGASLVLVAVILAIGVMMMTKPGA
jgi:hypothetical protein